MSAAFMGVLVLLDMLPLKYLALAALILFFLWCITFTTQAVRKKKGVFMGVSNNVVILSFISTILKYSISLSPSLTPLVSS